MTLGRDLLLPIGFNVFLFDVGGTLGRSSELLGKGWLSKGSLLYAVIVRLGNLISHRAGLSGRVPALDTKLATAGTSLWQSLTFDCD